MNAEFSEFSYGFALSYEITNAFRPQIVGAPLFPSLLQEAKDGYDVKFRLPGVMLFLQFKLADYLKTSRATYRSYYKAPYSRVAIHKLKHSKQHNLLRKLSSIEPLVFYVAPAFYRQSIFNEAFKVDCIIKQSVFFPLQVLPDLTDNDQHHLTFQPRQNGFHWHSEEAQHFELDISGQSWIDIVHHSNDLWDRGINTELLIELRSGLAEIIRTSGLQMSFEIDEVVDLGDNELPTIIRDLRYMLITYFCVEPTVLRRAV